jgi:ATP-dependent helicase IRC3
MSPITEISPRKERKPRRPTTNIRLYNYQSEAITACLDHFVQGKNRIAVSSPTGSGKTTMMLSVIERLWGTAEPNRRQVLILVPSIQIAGQIKDAAKQYLKGQHKFQCTIEVEQGENKTDGDADM